MNIDNYTRISREPDFLKVFPSSQYRALLFWRMCKRIRSQSYRSLPVDMDNMSITNLLTFEQTICGHDRNNQPTENYQKAMQVQISTQDKRTFAHFVEIRSTKRECN